MISPLKFVMGAVAKKDYQPALTHFRIANGRVTGFNGTIALSSPIDLDLVACPKALPFVKAIERCGETTVMHMTPGGRLSLKSGKFKAFIECAEETDILDGVQPEGVGAEFPGVVIQALRVLEPFIGFDASRPWATGILLRGASAYATNNIVVAEYWLGQEVPEINIPSAAVRELLRLKQEPIATTLSENSITFHFEGDRWMRTQLLGVDWPDVEPLLSMEGELTPLPPGLFPAIETLAPFVGEEGRLYFREGRLSTSALEGEGASLEVEGLPTSGAYHHVHLSSLQGVADSIDFSKHPKPCPFRGDRVRGIILGMVDA